MTEQEQQLLIDENSILFQENEKITKEKDIYQNQVKLLAAALIIVTSVICILIIGLVFG